MNHQGDKPYDPVSDACAAIIIIAAMIVAAAWAMGGDTALIGRKTGHQANTC